MKIQKIQSFTFGKLKIAEPKPIPETFKPLMEEPKDTVEISKENTK